MNDIGKKQVIIFFVSALAAIVFYFISLIFCIHFTNLAVFQNVELWLKDTYHVKDMINNQPTHKQRLIVIGGSSTLYGFNGAMVEANTNFRFINYGTHAILPLNYHIDKIISQAKDNDTIILPLEFSYYTLDAPTDNYAYIQNMIVWGGDYRKYIDQSHIILAFIKNDPTQLLLGNGKYIIRTLSQQQHISIEAILHKKQNLTPTHFVENIAFVPCQSFDWYAVSYQSLSPSGDFCSAEGKRYFNEMNDFLAPNLKLSNFFISEYKRLESFAKAHNIKLFLIYPPTMENPLFSLDDKETFTKIENLKQELAKHDIKIYGDFRDFHFDRKYFFDTAYHLNAEGANLRTYYFLKQLPKMLEQQ
ncbi:hypothetical protein Hc94105_1172 [Helicobacter cinaedi]|uniref:hypothetical protein n=1 Tax=Helicobacter cinaedi TaxID=213 RepID=UPI001F4826AF|nr:hypothetical protein [Helicobacter cinaedi]BDB66970.1 hypothetical protein Hc94105_1172 [Helicobacter cinaedi]